MKNWLKDICFVTAAGIQVAMIVLHELVCDSLQKCSRIRVETMDAEQQYFEGSCVTSFFISFARFNMWLLSQNL
jgi:hypothetical protein